MKKSAIRFFAAVLITLMTPLFLPAAGRSEDPIRQARELVSNNRINEAILLLEQTVRDDPDRIVEAENLMRMIRDIRGEYNVLFELLIDNLVNNPDDITRTLEIIDRMEGLDEFPNERVLRQVEDARIIAQLAFDRNVVEETMEEARIALENDDYFRAIQLYLSMEDLQRSEFEARGFGQIFVNRVEEVVNRLETIATAFLDRVEPYRDRGEPVLRRAEEEILELDNELFDPFLEEVVELLSVLDRAEELSQEILVLRTQVPLQFPDQPVEWYINFKDIVARGRGGFREQEGLVYAIRRLYREYPRKLAEITGEDARGAFREGLQELDEDRPESAVPLLVRAREAGGYLERAEALLLEIAEEPLSTADIAERFEPEQAQDLISARAIHRGAEGMRGLAETITPLVELPEDQETPMPTLQTRKDTVREVFLALSEGELLWEEARQGIEAVSEDYAIVGTGALLNEVTDRWSSGVERAVQRERSLAVRIAGLRTETVPSLLARVPVELGQVAPLLEGVEEPIDNADEVDDGTAVRIVRYPDEALERMGPLESELDAALEIVRVTRTEIEEDADHVTSGEGVQQEVERLASLEEELFAFRTQALAITNRAETLIADAVEQRDSGYERLADARAAIAAMQINAARNNFEAAREAFFQSLELREDPDLRDEADQEIAELGRELLELENVIVIQRVRELITQAEAQYNQDQYVAARDTLLQAQQTWEQTNVDPNSEIDRLLLLTTAALNLEEGRELAETDPLYPVLGNYLSLAREDFQRGMRLFEDGREQEADRYFDRAIENLRNVRDVRPLNWESRILELRIVQVRDADEFDEIFAARYNQAVNRLDQVGPLEVYGEIEVLAEINPDYPGIQEQLRQLEIALNLRPDPIDQQRITRAQQLFQQAENLSTGSRDQMAVAVSLLEDAVDLNPGNNNARFLLDQLRIRLGGQATASLSTTDEQQYRRAETLFQQGQVLQSLAITERLLSNPANQGYPPLVELRRRIGLRLGI